MSHIHNVSRIKAVHKALGDLRDKVVFVGGATVSLYIDRTASEVRPTEDVDLLVELVSYSGYAEIEDQLREKGFVNDNESGVICRFKYDDIVVDVMATSSDVLGFTNRWYSEGFLHLIDKDLGGHCSVKILQSPYFIATKMEAFKNRGGGDGRMSSDFEDIVYVLNNRKSVWNELSDATDSVKSYLKDEFAQLLMSDVLFEWVGAHLEYSEQERVGVILSSIEKFIGNEFLGEHVSIHTH
jgi:hypothetical protein